MSCSFEKALEYSGTKAKTLNNLATMYYRLGMYTQYNSTHTSCCMCVCPDRPLV